MMEGENVKAFAKTFTLPLLKAARTPDFSSGLVLPLLKLWRIYPTSVPSLGFLLLLGQTKSKSLSGGEEALKSFAKQIASSYFLSMMTYKWMVWVKIIFCTL